MHAINSDLFWATSLFIKLPTKNSPSVAQNNVVVFFPVPTITRVAVCVWVGGVAVGASANLKINPAGALGIGLIAGCLSTFGFYRITSFLEQTFLKVFSLHCICLGVFASVSG